MKKAVKIAAIVGLVVLCLTIAIYAIVPIPEIRINFYDTYVSDDVTYVLRKNKLSLYASVLPDDPDLSSWSNYMLNTTDISFGRL